MAAHVVADVLYPKERTALYLVPLFIGGLVALAGSYRRGPVRWCALAMLSILSLTSIEQFTTGSYGEWPYDAGSRGIAELLAAESARRERPIRVAATQFLYQPALEFYRLTRFHDRVDLVLDGFDPLRAGDFDLVVVNDEDGRRLPGSCDEIYVDPVSGARVRQCARDTAADARPRAVGTSGPDAAP